MGGGAGAVRSIGQFVRLSFCRCNEIGNRVIWRGRIDHDNVVRSRDQRNRREIGMGIVRQLGFKAWIHRIGERSHQKRVAVRFTGRHRLGTDDGARSRFVFDDDRRTQILAHLLRQRARHHIRAAARRKRNDDLDDALGIGC